MAASQESAAPGQGEGSTPPPVRWPVVGRGLDVLAGTIARVCAWLITGLLLLMLGSVAYQVVARYWLTSVVGGPEEIARLGMIAMVFFGLPVLAYYSENIRLDVAQEVLRSARIREWLIRAALAIELVFFVLLAMFAYQFLEQLAASRQQTPALGIRLVWSRAPVLVGTVLAAVVSACVLGRRLLGAYEAGAHHTSVRPI